MIKMNIDIDKIIEETSQLFPNELQVALQGVNGGKKLNYGVGRLAGLDHKEQDFIIPNFDIPYTNSILSMLGMYRSRIMRMTPRSCYSYHKDPSKRIHIPLITSEKCFMVIDDVVYRYPADGNYYLVDTTKMHTFVNTSTDVRVHIVGCVDGL